MTWYDTTGFGLSSYVTPLFSGKTLKRRAVHHQNTNWGAFTVFPPVRAILLQLVVGKKSWGAVLLFCPWWLKCFHRAFKYDLLERDSKSEALAWTCIFEVHFLRCNEIWIIHCKIKFCTIKLYTTGYFLKNPVKDCHQICYSYQLTQTEDRLISNSQGHIVLSQKVTK